jgi:hypothetical protein
VATRSWHSRARPTWRIWFTSRLGRLRNVKNQVPLGLPFTGALVLFVAASITWRALPMAAAGAGLVLILQDIAAPTPLFWTVPWEVLEFILSRQVRANHFWLHRTADLLRESGGRLTKVDGLATREGFFLLGTSLNETEVQWASQCASGTLCQKSSAKVAAPGCKTMQFLLALWLIAGGLTVLSLWRGVGLASALLLSALCGAAGQLLAGRVERLLGPWAEHLACSGNKTEPIRLEVESLAIPCFLLSKKSLVFQVRRMPLRESNEGYAK